MSIVIEVQARFPMPQGTPLEVVEEKADGLSEIMLEVERDTRLEFGPVVQINSTTNDIFVFFTVDSNVLMRVGAALQWYATILPEDSE